MIDEFDKKVTQNMKFYWDMTNTIVHCPCDDCADLRNTDGFRERLYKAAHATFWDSLGEGKGTSWLDQQGKKGTVKITDKFFDTPGMKKERKKYEKELKIWHANKVHGRGRVEKKK